MDADAQSFPNEAPVVYLWTMVMNRRDYCLSYKHRGHVSMSIHRPRVCIHTDIGFIENAKMHEWDFETR
jgi:hypothetical protein